MAQKAKYPAQNLTEEDKQVLEAVAFKYVAKFYHLTQKYNNPKEYAQREILKPKSDTDIAAVYTIINAINSPPGYLFRPREINEKLANQLKNSIIQGHVDKESNRLLHPQDLRQKDLKRA